ncbi:hypothetical protein ONZ51_g385 [Trametes cubensis]|uniref:Uncharacterized protein n=1 Tax=Trametes cubensis TaxID=1111947 RepID=A0AAD7U444_9APHY|nr:hypothetical protein ONZ51_g385 [Trametes cubensis]
MLSRLASKKNARVNAAESSAAANASTAQASQPTTSGSTSPMRTRSGKRLVAPIAEGMKAVKAKLGAGRRGKKAPTEEPAVAGPSTSVQAVAEMPDSAPAPAPPAPKSRSKRSTTARGRSTRGKASKAKSAPKSKAPAPQVEDAEEIAEQSPTVILPAPTNGVPTAASSAGPSAEAISGPSAVPLPETSGSSSATASRRYVVPESHRITRQYAFFFDKDGWPLPQGTYPDEVPESSSAAAPSTPSVPNPAPRPARSVPENHRLTRQGAFYFDKNGRQLPQGAYPSDVPESSERSALLQQLAREINLDDLMRPRAIAPIGSIYGLERFRPKYTHPYYPLIIPVPKDVPIVFPSVPPAVQPTEEWNPIVFPTVTNPEVPQEPEPRAGTLITRQNAAFFDEDGQVLPTGREGADELEPIGEIVASILKAGCTGAYPSTWRGSLFEQEEAAPAAPAATPSSTPVAPTAASDMAAERPVRSLPAIPPSRRLTRQGAVYLDKDGHALPRGVTTTAAAQFPKTPAPTAPRAPSGPSAVQYPKVVSGGASAAQAAEAGPSRAAQPSPEPRGSTAPKAPATPSRSRLGSLFARRSQTQLATYNRAAEVPPVPASQEQASAPLPEAPDTSAETDRKGKKRAREDEDDAAEAAEVEATLDQAPRKRLRMITTTVSVRSYTVECGKLRAKLSVIPIPALDAKRCGGKCDIVLFPSEKEAFAEAATATKRSREDFEDGSAVSAKDADEPPAKKARVEA